MEMRTPSPSVAPRIVQIQDVDSSIIELKKTTSVEMSLLSCQERWLRLLTNFTGRRRTPHRKGITISRSEPRSRPTPDRLPSARGKRCKLALTVDKSWQNSPKIFVMNTGRIVESRGETSNANQVSLHCINPLTLEKVRFSFRRHSSEIGRSCAFFPSRGRRRSLRKISAEPLQNPRATDVARKLGRLASDVL